MDPAVFVRRFFGPNSLGEHQVAGLTSPTRGNKISTCYQGALGDPPVLGWAPGIGCLQFVVPPIIPCITPQFKLGTVGYSKPIGSMYGIYDYIC